jgi:hypothetical protein
MPNLDNGVADSPAPPTPEGHKTGYENEAKALHLPLHDFRSFYDCFIGDAPSNISAPMREVHPRSLEPNSCQSMVKSVEIPVVL